MLRSVREALPPLFEFATPMPYVELQQMLDDSAPWGVLSYDKALYLDDLTDEVIAVMAQWLPRKTSPIFPLGGAYRGAGEADAAFGGRRDAGFSLSISALAQDRQAYETDREWARSFWDALRPFASDSGSYVNFMSEYEEDRVRAAYGPAKYDRLARTKAVYDPDNVFHRNANIKPAAEAAQAVRQTARTPAR